MLNLRSFFYIAFSIISNFIFYILIFAIKKIIELKSCYVLPMHRYQNSTFASQKLFLLWICQSVSFLKSLSFLALMIICQEGFGLKENRFVQQKPFQHINASFIGVYAKV